MVKVYADLIMKGEKTLEQVPQILKEKVRQELINRGYIDK